jgi:hypothetical protein
MDMNLESIKRAIAAERIRITDHADEEMAADGLSLDEVLDTVASGEIVEDYPSDRPLPSCLVLGQNREGQLIHSVWAYNEASGVAVLITVYRVDPQRWIDGRIRK